MKHLILVLVSFLFSVLAIAQQKNSIGYIISGKINGLPDGVVFYLIKESKDGRPDTTQRSVSKSESFQFQGKLVLEGELYFVKMDTSGVKLEKGKKTWIRLLLTNTIINIHGDLKQWPYLDIIGSAATTEYEDFVKANDPELAIVLEKNASKDTGIAKNAEKNYLDFLLSYFTSHPDSYATPHFANKIQKLNSKQRELIYNSLTARVKDSFPGLNFKNNINQLKKSELIKLGMFLPDFEIMSPKGSKLSIREFIKNGEITLIDFWASWCSPCREAIPNIKRVYDAFHRKGFNVIGISIDKNESEWRKAIAEEKTPWVHGRDSIEDAYKGIFDISAIPAFVLIDKDGKLLAFSCFASNIPSFGPSIYGDGLYNTIEKLVN